MMLHSPTLHRRLSSWSRRFCALILLLAFVLGFAPPLAASGAPAKNVANGPRTKKQIALTFDVENQTNLSSVLSTLKSTNTPATFFVLGNIAERFPQIVPSIRTGGHELANHTYSHNYLTTMSHSEIVADLQRAQRLLEQQAGGKISSYFRPPYGSYNSASLAAIGAAGFSHAVLWDVDPRDWSGVSADHVRQEVLNEAQNGSIVLFHIQAGSNTHAALPGIISGLKQRGYELVTVSTLLGYSQPGTPPGTSTTHTVRAGESWWAIAQRYGVNYVTLAQANGRKTTDHIYVGERLVIPIGQSGPGTQPTPTPTPTPPPSTSNYTVRSGDTLWAIALRYKTTVQAIVNENKLANPNLLRVGQVLRIPGQAGSTPAPTPTPDPTPTPTPDPTPSPSRYTVRAGDTMWGIARSHNVSLNALIAANKLANPNVLVVGQQLTIPGGSGGSTPAPTPTPPPTSTTIHTVRAGDTLWDISRRYGVTIQAIVNANNMSNANLIRVGQRLTIPR